MHQLVDDGIRADLATVEEHMRQALETDEPRVSSLIADLGQFHGKMLRPVMVLLVARCVDGISDEHRVLAAALELIHTATLIHDDIIDAAITRRGQATAHQRFGTSVAVLLGDYFYTHAFDLVAGFGRPEVLAAMTAATNTVCRGELQQMIAKGDATISEAEYERIIYAKTAALCELACRLGAVGGDQQQQRAAAAFGRACGMAFQIVDDCLDVIGDAEKIGKTVATDLGNGRLTLPFIRLLAMVDAHGRSDLQRRLEAVGSEAEVAELHRRVREGGGVESAMQTARAYVAEALGHLALLPDRPDRQHLADLASFIVARDF
jgi:octaprenyl-diphosphate synthase